MNEKLIEIIKKNIYNTSIVDNIVKGNYKLTSTIIPIEKFIDIFTVRLEIAQERGILIKGFEELMKKVITIHEDIRINIVKIDIHDSIYEFTVYTDIGINSLFGIIEWNNE